MMHKSNVLTVSVIAMLVAGAARAEIASSAYVASQIEPVSSAVTALQTNKQDKSNMIQAIDNAGTLELASNSVAEQNSKYLSAAATVAVVSDMMQDYTSAQITQGANIEALQNGKANKAPSNAGITSGDTATKTKITYNKEGIVIGGADLQPSDIPNIATSKVNALTNYTKGSDATALSASDTLNAALGKLENKADNAASVASANATAIAGKQATIDSEHKLDADLVDDSTSTNKFVTASEKSTWSGKQDAITTTNKLGTNLIDTSDSAQFVSASEKSTWSGKQDAITAQSPLSYTLVDGLATVAHTGNASDVTEDATHRFVTDTQKSEWSGKQDAITAQSPLSYTLVDGLATVAHTGNASDLNNDAGFITKSVSDLTNYTTTTDLNTELAKKQDKLTAGDRISITKNNETGVVTISASDQAYTLPVATDSSLGGVIVGNNVSVANDGTISVATATDSAKGVVQVGSNINVNSGTISVSDAANNAKGVIRIATDSEASTGSAENLAVNPKQLATKQDAGNYITVPAPSNNETGRMVLTYDSEANNGAGAYYWESIGR